MIATLRTIIQAVKEQNQADAKRPRANSAGDATSACVKIYLPKGLRTACLKFMDNHTHATNVWCEPKA